MQRQTRTELYSSTEAALLGSEDLAQEGWKIDRKNAPPVTFGFKLEVTYYRVVPDHHVDPEKKSRAEILERARAAKAAKKEVK